MGRIVTFIKKEIVLVVAVVLALISCFFVVPSEKYLGYIDFKVLGCLFCLMIVVAGFTSVRALDVVSIGLLNKAKGVRSIYLILVFITFFSAMIVTNDVALITFVPLAITILKMSGEEEYVIVTVVMQTIAANLGGALTPFGNPQNLYLFSFFNLEVGEFFSITGPIVAFSGVVILLSVFLVKSMSIKVSTNTKVEITDKKRLIVYALMFILAVLAVFNVVSYVLAVCVTVVAILLVNRRLFLTVDYSLLFTFVGFFIFVGNMSNIEAVKNFLSSAIAGKELLSSVLVSQVISNVPAAILLSNFTQNYKDLLLGVNIGGLGTLIASLASVISYKIYCKEENAKVGKYFGTFMLYNVIGLLFLLVFAGLLY